MRRLILLISHTAAVALGFALGVYYLPILTAPDGPDQAALQQSSASALYSASFTRDLRGSDRLHWGEGTISVTPTQIVHDGRLSPGPDYKLYLTPAFVEDEAEFEAIKAQSVQVGDVKSFDGVILDVPSGVDVNAYTSVVVWCEAFGEFITAAQYR